MGIVVGLDKNKSPVKIKNLVVYACSHGKFGTAANGIWRDQYSWPYLVARELDLQLYNKSVEGSHNYGIFSRCLSDYHSNLIDRESLVIIQWSHINRAWQKNGNTAMPNLSSKQSRIFYKYLYNEHQEITKVLGYTLILEKLIENLLFDFSDGRQIFERYARDTVGVLDKIWGYMNCNNECITHVPANQLFPCSHLNKLGHQNQADIYAKKIQQKMEISIN